MPIYARKAKASHQPEPAPAPSEPAASVTELGETPLYLRAGLSSAGAGPAIQRKRRPGAADDAAVEETARTGMAAGGEPLPEDVRGALERSFRHDLSAARVHTGGAAAASAAALNARAYTTGPNIVFAEGHYAPETPQGRRLLAHEMAHVVQQAAGDVPPGLAEAESPQEHTADDVAARVMEGGDAGSLLPASGPAAITATSASAVAVQRDGPPQTGGGDPNALIPVADFISYIEAVERAYASDTPEEVLTRIRQQYYSGLGFDELIPDAPRMETVRPGRLYTTPSGVPMGPFSYVPPDIRQRRFDQRIGAAAYTHLTARANENAVGDNPSPYIVMPDGSRIDVGHLLLGLDSLVHPRTSDPYTAYGIPGIDPASWVADLALASYWTTYHQNNGSPAGDAPVRPTSADFNTYYAASAPNEDLLGDADSFGTFQQRQAQPGQTLSQILRAYYLGVGGAAPGVNRRWRTFCAANGLGYSVSGGTAAWSASAIEAVYEPRISRLCDLFQAGFFSHVGSVTLGTSPNRGAWPYSITALRRFLDWVKPRLEAEIRANP